MLSSISMVYSIGLRHTRVLAHARHGMRRQRCGSGIVLTAQAVVAARKHQFTLIQIYTAHGRTRAPAQTFLHAHAAPLRTDDHRARMRVRHADINSAGDGNTFVGICRVSRAKIRRQTVRAEGKPASFSAVFARRDFCVS